MHKDKQSTLAMAILGKSPPRGARFEDIPKTAKQVKQFNVRPNLDSLSKIPSSEAYITTERPSDTMTPVYNAVVMRYDIEQEIWRVAARKNVYFSSRQEALMDAAREFPLVAVLIPGIAEKEPIFEWPFYEQKLSRKAKIIKESREKQAARAARVMKRLTKGGQKR